MRRIYTGRRRVLELAILGALLVLLGLTYATHQQQRVVGQAEDSRLSLTTTTAQKTYSSGIPLALSLTNQVDATATVSLALPEGVELDWAATQKLWGDDHPATRTGQDLVATAQALHVTTTQSGQTLTFSWPKATADTTNAKISFALNVPDTIGDMTLQPEIANTVLGTKLTLASAASSSSSTSSTSSSSSSSSSASATSVVTPKLRARSAAATPASGTLSITSGDDSYLFADGSVISAVVTNTQTPGAVVTIGLGGTTLNWAQTYQAWRAMDASTTSSDDFTKLTADNGASLTLSTQGGQQVVEIYVPTSGDSAGSVPLVLTPKASLSDVTLTPLLADGTKGTAGKWQHITIIDPDTEEANLYTWLENAKGNDATKFAVGATGAVHIRVENLTNRNAVVQLAAATTLDLSKTKIVAGDNQKITKKSTTTATGAQIVYTIKETDPSGVVSTKHVTVVCNQKENRITVSSSDGGAPELYFYFTVNSGGGNSGYTIASYMDDGSDGRAWTMKVTGDVTPATERVQIKKVDAQDESQVLAGAKFQLTDTADATDDQTSAATDSTGLTTVVPKNAGTRTLALKEVTPPTGYGVATGTYEVQWSKLLGITAVRVPGDAWGTTTSDGVVSVKDNQLTFRDSKTGQITVQEYDRATNTVLATHTYTGENGQALSVAHPGANVPATHEGLTIWGTTMGAVDDSLDPYDANNLPDPIFGATAQTLTYVYDMQMFELDPDATLEFGQFSPTKVNENYLIGTQSRVTQQTIPYGATVIDRIGVGSWQLSVAQDAQFSHDSDRSELNDARLWFKNLQVTSAGGDASTSTQFQTKSHFTLVPGAQPTAIVSATVAPSDTGTTGSQSWRVNFGTATTGGQSVGLYVPDTTTRLNGHYSTTLTWTADQLP